MIRYVAWSLFLFLTLGLVDVHVYYNDGFVVEYDNWFDKRSDYDN